MAEPHALPAPSPAPASVRRGGWIADLAFAVLTVVGFVAVALATGVRGPWNGVIPLALVLGALLLVRRRWPMAVLLLSVAAVFAYHLAHVSPAGWIWPVAAAYFTAAGTSRVRWVVVVGVAQLVYSAVDARWMIDRNLVRYLVHTLGEGVLLAALVAAGLAYAAAQRRGDLLREAAYRARAAEERLSVAREVHDLVAHTLAVVGVHLNVAADALREDPDEAAAALRLAQDVRNRAMKDLNSLIAVLREGPAGTEPQPDVSSLGVLVADARAAGLDVTLHEHGDLSAIPAPVSVAVHRIVREALANTLRHSGATTAEVAVARHARSVTVEVTDNGKGDPAGGGITDGNGLTGMRERVHALGGTLTAGPTPRGFAVKAEIPVAGSPE
ncbi:two-component sensor histidine kinase [Microbispora rosea subsp. aerata]|nr:histidine kinase [Microbispora rosea]GGO30506.1 two-component sensor histidine kinase [Microbispora rosea subsp. aerata]GIH59020.1 two-component sensor histidine kinase [Microbispora rosea subsp. aerata]GLJ85402.1 two-component sensor histidine kinase [Microbispora rosea subsp. aerata]